MLSLSKYVLYHTFVKCYGLQSVPFGNRNGCSTETVHIGPHVGKAKMHLVSNGFIFENCKQTAEKCEQIFEN